MLDQLQHRQQRLSVRRQRLAYGLHALRASNDLQLALSGSLAHGGFLSGSRSLGRQTRFCRIRPETAALTSNYDWDIAISAQKTKNEITQTMLH
jgi:hypothetical protein